ncbi:MAG: GCN5-related N-acetyltransferase [Frankiales bacterium]|nr:GCN5-related N-acetyltransferase [Frankiales bacterium]
MPLYEWLFAPPGGRPPQWDAGVAEKRVLGLIESDRATVLVTDDLSGFCTVVLDLPSVRFGQRAWVEDLAVDPARRSSGIGKALLDAAKAWAVAHAASHLELDSGDGRLDAHRFYEREQPSWTSRCFSWWLAG